jgi:hypothetical protein
MGDASESPDVRTAARRATAVAVTASDRARDDAKLVEKRDDHACGDIAA